MTGNDTKLLHLISIQRMNNYAKDLELISYHRKSNGGRRDHVHEALEAYVQEGTRRLLAAALGEEVNVFLGRHRYESGKASRGYRNGYHPSQEITGGLGPVEVQVPWVARVPLPPSVG